LSSEDATDVVQDVFAAVADGVHNFRGDRGKTSFLAWLRTITLNKVRDYFRQPQSPAAGQGGTDAQRRMLEIPQHVAAGQSDDDAQSACRLVHRGVGIVRAEFEDRTWQAFYRVTVDGQPARDVADELNISVDAVYQAKSRVLRRLRELIDDPEVEAQ
jgi:RNA polymerase sigma-70 factor (ECF subfamily)